MTVSFDRFGKCPICRKLFQSKRCPHSYGYVVSVLADAERQRDIEKTKTANSG